MAPDSSLPPAGTVAAWEALPREHPAFEAAALRIARRHGLAERAAPRFARGSLPVMALGAGRVVKLFPPVYAGEQAWEARVLAALAGRLPVATPAPLAAGELDGWRYLLMERVPGVPLADLRDGLDAPQRAALTEELGRALAALHALGAEDRPAGGLAWGPFLAGQLAGCVARQRGRGLGEEWLAQVPAYLAASGVADAAAPEVLLHTEVMPDHLLVRSAGERLRLAGLVDFEPAMRGPAEYELASLAVFHVRGDLALWDAFFAGYGAPAPGWRRRAMAYVLLHRYSRFAAYLESVPPGGARRLEEVERAWFG